METPGIDGLPVEFYKTAWNIIKEDFVKVIRYAFSYIKLSKDMNSGVIILISKIKNPCSVKDQRSL